MMGENPWMQLFLQTKGAISPSIFIQTAAAPAPVAVKMLLTKTVSGESLK
jgi:hypothetical protein